MEGNRDESEHCIEIAEKYLNEGQKEKGLKYLFKAEKLFPSDRARELIEKFNQTSAASTPTDDSPTENGDIGDGASKARRRFSTSRADSNTAGSASGGEESKPQVEYTKDQIEAVKRIKRCKDYYEILGITKESTDSDLKKAYRKLALQFHPDKNKAPGAAEAFKAIGNAFAVLSDPEKRKRYDMYGGEDQQIRRSSHRRYAEDEYDYTRGFEADVTAEELFNMFFGGGFPSGNVYVRRNNQWRSYTDHRHGHAEHRQPEMNYTALLQMLPILILVFLSLMSSFFVSEPAYSLQKTSKYAIERTTKNLKVPYFVKDTFKTEYQGSIRRVEAQVEDDYLTNLRASCIRERNYKESMLYRARSFGDKQLLDRANGLRTPSCDTLQGIYS